VKTIFERAGARSTKQLEQLVATTRGAEQPHIRHRMLHERAQCLEVVAGRVRHHHAGVEPTRE
jgi:hypothetical protein